MVKREARPDLSSGKVKKNVRFAFEDVDKNKKEEGQFELEKRRPIVIGCCDKWSLYVQRLFGITEPLVAYSKEQRKGALLHKLMNKGTRKLKADFDLGQILKDLANFRMMFNYYRLRHSDLMIEVNQQRKMVLNLEDDDWENELDKPAWEFTKFDTHVTSQSSISSITHTSFDDTS